MSTGGLIRVGIDDRNDQKRIGRFASWGMRMRMWMRLQQGPNKGKEWTGSAAMKLAKMERKWSIRVVGVEESKVGGTTPQALTGLKTRRSCPRATGPKTG